MMKSEEECRELLEELQNQKGRLCNSTHLKIYMLKWFLGEEKEYMKEEFLKLGVKI